MRGLEQPSQLGDLSHDLVLFILWLCVLVGSNWLGRAGCDKIGLGLLVPPFDALPRQVLLAGVLHPLQPRLQPPALLPSGFGGLLRRFELGVEGLVDARVALDVLHEQLVPTFATPGPQQPANEGRGRARLESTDVCYLELAGAADRRRHGSGLPVDGAGGWRNPGYLLRGLPRFWRG